MSVCSPGMVVSMELPKNEFSRKLKSHKISDSDAE